MKTCLLLAAALLFSAAAFSQSAPELIFQNPVLKNGTDKKEGAIYRYSNVTAGVDAEIKLKKFSRNTIVMNTVDNSALGWSKAFQPEFGLAGIVDPYQNWYVDFEMTFYEAGKTKKVKMAKVDLTSLDVDGDSWSISEYVVMNNASSVAYSTVSYLLGNLGTAGSVGQSFTCDNCNVASVLQVCNQCGGDGIETNGDQCDKCDGSGKVFLQCQHAYHVANTVQGPVENFLNIDTLATQVMATYRYVNVDKITFRYGAKSGANSSNGSGIRLNSLWFRQFSLVPHPALPVKLSQFNATLTGRNVNLSWTGHEENFSHYVLQRSTDGKTYSDVAVVFAGAAGTATNYQYRDANVASTTGMLFYRLQMVDLTKEATLSDVRVIRLGAEAETLRLAVYPNPVKDELRLTLPQSWQGKPVLIELFSANGTGIQRLQRNSAGQTETVQAGALAKGVYLVKLTCEGQSAQERIVKN